MVRLLERCSRTGAARDLVMQEVDHAALSEPELRKA
jgi:hypothetical protein